MKIIKMNKVVNVNNKTAAYFDIETNDGIIIKGFRLVNSQNGLFLSAPSEKGKDGKFYETIILPKEMKKELEKMAINEYNKNKLWDNHETISGIFFLCVLSIDKQVC